MIKWSSTRVPRSHNGQMIVSSTNGDGKIEYPHARMDPYLTPHSNFNWKCFKDLHVRHETIKLPEENFQDTAMGNDFLDMTSKTQVTKAKIDT